MDDADALTNDDVRFISEAEYLPPNIAADDMPCIKIAGAFVTVWTQEGSVLCVNVNRDEAHATDVNDAADRFYGGDVVYAEEALISSVVVAT